MKTYDGVSLKRFDAAQDRILIKLIRQKKDLERLSEGMEKIIGQMQDQILILEGKVTTLEDFGGGKKKS